MVEGRVNKFREPVIRIGLLGRTGIKVNAIIDTGFNGYVSVPTGLIRRLGWERVASETYELASGEEMVSDTYLGAAKISGRVKQILAVAGSPREVLIGTRLMDGMELRVNFVSDRVELRTIHSSGS